MSQSIFESSDPPSHEVFWSPFTSPKQCTINERDGLQKPHSAQVLAIASVARSL